jgi:putative membrane protein
MHRKIMFGTVAIAGLTLIAACNQNTSSLPATNPPTQTANNQAPDNNAPNASTTTDNTTADQTASNEPQPGSKNETVSAAKDAVAGGVGTLSAEFTTTTKGFVEAAALSDMYEVQAGQLASMRAHMPELKKFAKDMVDAHTMTSSQLKGLLAKAAPDITPPTQLDSRHEAMLNDLKGAKDEDFDGRYIAQQINAHNEANILMRGYAKDGDKPEIKTFAADTQPKVQMHLDMINDIDRKYRANNAQARNAGTNGTATR